MLMIMILTVTVTVILIAMVIVIVKMIMMIKMLMVTGTTAKKLRKLLVLWPEVTFSDHPLMPQVREFKIPRRLQRWNRRLKVYSRCIILYRDYSNSLALWNVGELYWGWSREATPHGKDMLKTTTTTTTTALIKKGDAWTYLRLAWVLLVLSYSHHSVRWYPLWNMLFPVNCILRIWLYFSLGCWAWHRIWGSWSKKWAFRNFCV